MHFKSQNDLLRFFLHYARISLKNAVFKIKESHLKDITGSRRGHY